MLRLHVKWFGKRSKPITPVSASVASIGGFDGIHRGHQALLERVKQRAKEQQCTSTVVLFYPLPEEFFAPQAASRIYPFARQLQLLEQAGIDQVVCLRFEEALSQVSATEFATFLGTEVKLSCLFIGDDFRFGYRRQGDRKLLEKFGQKHRFTVKQMGSVSDESERISSTEVRKAILKGDFPKVTRLLGRDYAFHGRIGHGDKKGHEIGFPTANMISGKYPLVAQGVYAGEVVDPSKACFASPQKCLVHCGQRPTFGKMNYRIEIHIPGFTGDLYGQHLTVYPHKKLREVRHFDSLNELKNTIQQDVRAAQQEWTKEYRSGT